MIDYSMCLLLFLALQDAHLPQPTKSQIATINMMGSENFYTRGKASKQLREQGRQALLSLERHGITNPDPEIASRSRRLICIYFNNEWPKLPDRGVPYIYGCYNLKPFKCPSGKTFTVPKGTARYYYQQSCGNDYSWNEAIFQNATNHYIHNLIRDGWQKHDLEVLLQQMQYNQCFWQYVDMLFDEELILDRYGPFDG